MNLFLGAGGLIVDEDGAILLVIESAGAKAGKWSFPAGKVEPGESIVDAMVREVHEETGIVAEPVDLLGVYHSLVTSEDSYGLNVVFRAVAVGGRAKPSEEHPEVRFVDRAEIARMSADGQFRSGELVDLVLADLDAGRTFPVSSIRSLGAT